MALLLFHPPVAIQGDHQPDQPLQHNRWWRGCGRAGEAYQAGTVGGHSSGIEYDQD